MGSMADGSSKVRLRWAAASVCLVLVAIIGSNSARRHAASEDARAAAMSAKAADEQGAHAATIKPARMLSLSEIQAHAAASRITHKAKNDVHVVKDAAMVNPNARLVHLLEKKAAVYEQAGNGQLKAAQRRQQAAAQDKIVAQGDLKKASDMQQKAKADKVQSQEAKESFRRAEQPTLIADKEMKAADKAYRHDMLDMAAIYPKIGADKAAGQPVPASLEMELKNLTAHLKADQAMKKHYGEMLASDAQSSALTSSFEDRIGKAPENVRAETTEYGLDVDVESAVKTAKHKMTLADERLTKGKEEEVVARRVLGIAGCITKHATMYSYDENKVGHVEHTYQRVLDDCNA